MEVFGLSDRKPTKTNTRMLYLCHPGQPVLSIEMHYSPLMNFPSASASRALSARQDFTGKTGHLEARVDRIWRLVWMNLSSHYPGFAWVRPQAQPARRQRNHNVNRNIPDC